MTDSVTPLPPTQAGRPAPRPAVFLDRDGTLIEERAYPICTDDIVPLPGVGAALRRLRTAGYLLIVLTNQSAVARGLIDEEGLVGLHEFLGKRLAGEGGHLDDIFYCPHHPDGVARAYAFACECRKPGHGLLQQAMARYAVNLSASVFVGDSPRDLFSGAGPCRARVLVQSGHALGDTSAADLIVPSLVEAVDYVVDGRVPELKARGA